MTTNTLHSVEFFDLQLSFAAKVADLYGISPAEATGRYTNIYVRLGMGASLDESNSDWRAYCKELSLTQDPAGLTHAVHRARLHLPIGPPHAAVFGCFSYANAGPGVVRLHFHAAGESRGSPLSAVRQLDRRSDLTQLFANLQATAGADVRVVGSSWLYNLPTYRRLFPERYVASLQAIDHPYQRLPLWGQFLNRDRSVRREAAERFLTDVARASSWESLAACFPLRVLATSSPAWWMYEHLNLAGSQGAADK